MAAAKWAKLVELDSDVIWAGSVIRAYLSYLGELTDFLVFSPNKKGYGEGLVYVTGYHAGTIYLVLPEESHPKGTGGVSRDWLMRNWTKSVDEKGDVNKVYVAERYPKPSEANPSGEGRGSRTKPNRPAEKKKIKRSF